MARGMTAREIIRKIITENECSIEMAEQLTKALHEEGYLNKDLVLRFRPLFCDFDFVPRAWLDSAAAMPYYDLLKEVYTGAFNMPNHALRKAAEATQAYEKFLATK